MLPIWHKILPTHSKQYIRGYILNINQRWWVSAEGKMLEEGAEASLNRRVLFLPSSTMFFQSVHEGAYILENPKYICFSLGGVAS